MGVSIMDPLIINQVHVRDKAMETMDNLTLFLEKHHDKSAILLPYNFGSATCISYIYLFQIIHCIFQETNTCAFYGQLPLDSLCFLYEFEQGLHL